MFQIVGITETIDKNSWITKIRSQFRVFNNVNYTKLRGTTTTTGVLHDDNVSDNPNPNNYVNDYE